MSEGADPTGWLSGGASGKPGKKRRVAAIGLVAAGVVAGGVLAGTLGASAASGTSTAGYGSGYGPPAEGSRPADSAKPVRSDEKPVSAAISATLTQKALAKVPGGKVVRVETDAGDAVYEVHMTKSDGSRVAVKFDKNLNVTAVEAGMGKGDPARGGPGGPGPDGGIPGRGPGHAGDRGPGGYGGPEGGTQG